MGVLETAQRLLQINRHRIHPRKYIVGHPTYLRRSYRLPGYQRGQK